MRFAEDLTTNERENMRKHAGSVIESAKALGKRNTAIIVDPVKNKEIARAEDWSGHPLQHAVIRVLDAVAKASFAEPHSQSRTSKTDPVGQSRKRCRTGLADGTNEEDFVAAPDCAAQSAVLPSQLNKVDQPEDMGGRPYLCTGYDCYVIREPCVMCAMALTHSRVRRVVYVQRDEEMGALGGAFRLHSKPSLNHHFQVFRISIEQDA